MLRSTLRFLIVFTLLMLAAQVAPALAQDSLSAVSDTTAIVWPAAFTLKNFVLANQAVLTTAATSLLLFLASQWSGFARLHDWITRIVQFLVGTGMSYLIVSLGGTPDPMVAALVTGAISTVVGGAIFRAGRTQPGN